jgi:hypothetical protein
LRSASPSAQQSTEADESLLTLRTAVSEVQLVFTVTDKHGHYVNDLKQNNFGILDGRKPPDRAGGLAIIGGSAYAFGPIVFAQGTMLAGLIASRIFYQGESILLFKLQAGGFCGFFVCIS